MKNLLLISTVIFALSCTAQNHKDLSNDDIIKKTFNAAEINDLLKIQGFFDKSIGLAENDRPENLEKGYTNFFLQNSDIEKAADFKLSINFSEQKGLYHQLDQKTFDNI
ncbi:MAG: hypothetical protein AB7S72_06955 [Draconibacterium sp.]